MFGIKIGNCVLPQFVPQIKKSVCDRDGKKPSGAACLRLPCAKRAGSVCQRNKLTAGLSRGRGNAAKAAAAAHPSGQARKPAQRPDFTAKPGRCMVIAFFEHNMFACGTQQRYAPRFRRGFLPGAMAERRSGRGITLRRRLLYAALAGVGDGKCAHGIKRDGSGKGVDGDGVVQSEDAAGHGRAAVVDEHLQHGAVQIERQLLQPL